MSNVTITACFYDLEVLPGGTHAIVGAKCQQTNKPISIPVPLDFVRENSELFFTGQPLTLELKICQ